MKTKSQMTTTSAPPLPTMKEVKMSEQVKHYWPEEIVGTGELVVYLQDYAALEVERDALRQQRDKLAQVLGNAEREHDLIRKMKNCEIHRDRGSFGVAVMSDPLALYWQALDKELQQLIDVRRDALAAAPAQPAAQGQGEVQKLREASEAIREFEKSGWRGSSGYHAGLLKAAQIVDDLAASTGQEGE